MVLGASTQVDCHRAMVVRSPMVRTLPAPVLGLNPGQGLSTTLPVGTPIIDTPSVLVRVLKTRKPVAGGKALSKPRERSQGGVLTVVNQRYIAAALDTTFRPELVGESCSE